MKVNINYNIDIQKSIKELLNGNAKFLLKDSMKKINPKTIDNTTPLNYFNLLELQIDMTKKFQTDNYLTRFLRFLTIFCAKDVCQIHEQHTFKINNIHYSLIRHLIKYTLRIHAYNPNKYPETILECYLGTRNIYIKGIFILNLFNKDYINKLYNEIEKIFIKKL